MKFDYLRHRPFLVIEFYAQPVEGTRTERKGWLAKQVEHPRLLQRISHTTMRTATVIIDVWNDRVLKNRLCADGKMYDDEVLEHYKAKYLT